MSNEQLSLELINKVIGGAKAPRYADSGLQGISESTYLTYVKAAKRIVAHFGPSQMPFKSIGQMKRLNKLCSGKKRMDLFSKIPLSTVMPKDSLISVIEAASPVITDSEEIRGCLLFPDLSQVQKRSDLSDICVSFMRKLYLLNITEDEEFELIVDAELFRDFKKADKKWGDYLCPDFRRDSFITFWATIVSLFFSEACGKVSDSGVRAEMSGYYNNPESFRMIVHNCLSLAIYSSIVKGRVE